MNNHRFNIIALGLAAASLAMVGTGCADSFLDVDSKTQSNTDNFYRTETDAWRALLGCYDGWKQTSSHVTQGFYLASTIMSDETYGASGNSDNRVPQAWDQFDQAQAASELTMFSDAWKYYYAGVYRCNELITRQDNIKWDAASGKRGLYIGEARALRAIMYFDMVRLWGNIPLFLTPSGENREQADPAEVYATIIDDLKFAAENIPATANRLPDETGRITKYAAETMLARVYLYNTGYYGKEPGFNGTGTLTKSEALNGLEDVIRNGGYGLVSEFKNLWPGASLVPIADNVGWDTDKSTYAGDGNSEILLAMKFTPTSNWSEPYDGNKWMEMIGMRNLNMPPYGQGWGFATVTPAYINKFDADDPRLTASVTDLVAEGVENYSWNNLTDPINDWREYTGYTVKKYCPLRYGNNTTGTNPSGTGDMQLDNVQQYVYMRYADVLLMAAELGSANAQTYFDQVRARSGRGSIALNHDNLMEERAREFAFESIRYWDLMRQANGGEVTALADAVIASGGSVLNGGHAAMITYDRAKILRTKGLCQIPGDQITLSNGVLKQNPGWN